MNKTLLATTAIAAVTGLATLASPAAAQEKLKLGIGGYFQAYVGYFDADNNGAASRKHFDFFREAEIHFNGEVALDNGMRVGIDVQLEAETSGDQIDESYLYFQGDFGKVILGSENSAAYLMSYGAVAADSNFDGADPNYSPYGVGFAYVPNITSDSEKITYISPRFAGFAFGASWTPDNTEDATGSAAVPAIDKSGAGGAGNTQNGIQADVFEFAINYENKFGDFGVLAAATYGFATKLETGNNAFEKQDQFSAGLNLTYAGFSIGAGYLWDDQGQSGDADREVYAIGGAWASGPLRIGASYAVVFDHTGGPNDVERYALAASYTYAPGMQLRGGVYYYNTEAAATYDDVYMFNIGTIIAF